MKYSLDINSIVFLVYLQLVVCWRRLRHTAQLTTTATGADKSQSSSRTSSITPANQLAILNLCADLYDNDASSLQLKVLKYVSSYIPNIYSPVEVNLFLYFCYF